MFLLIMPVAAVMQAAAMSHADVSRLISKCKEQLGRHEYVEAIGNLFVARREADAGGWAGLQFEAECNLGIGYVMISENGEAMNHFYKAAEICDANGLSRQQRLLVMNGIASIYFDEGNMDKAGEMMQQCYNDALKAGDSLQTASYALNLALISNRTGRYEDAARYIGVAKRYKRYGNTAVMLAEADMLYRTKHYDDVLAMSPAILGNASIGNDDKTDLLISMICIARERGERQRAFACAADAWKTAGLSSKPRLCQLISELWQEEGDLSMALSYRDSASIYKDSLIRKQNRTLVENNRIKLELLEMQKKMDSELARSNSQRQIYLLMLCICVLVLAITIVTIRNMRVRSRQAKRLMMLEQERLQQEKLLAETQMKETELAAKYRQEIMNRTIEQKSRELATASMFLTSRNSLIEELLRKYQAYREAGTEPDWHELVNSLRLFLKTADEHDRFLINFEAVHPGLLTRIKERHPNLSESDLYFLAYVQMNMPTREIASLMNITPNSCKRRKLRISKKLGLDSSSDMQAYIAGI